MLIAVIQIQKERKRVAIMGPHEWHASSIHLEDRRAPASIRSQPPARETTALLPLVMAEICELMHAKGTILTLHASNEGEPAALFTDRHLSEQTYCAVMHKLTSEIRSEFEDDSCFWRDLSEDESMLVMPVKRIDGHGQLVICAVFRHAGLHERQEAERLYRERRPFAIGFFQLWQHNRVLQQRAHALELSLDHTAIGLVMIDRTGHIVFANHTANEILAVGDGISRSNNMLRAISLADSVNLQAAISHAIARDEAHMVRGPIRAPLLAFNRRHGPPLVAAFLPATTPTMEDGDVAAIMYLVDPQMDTAKMLSPLCRLYGLSPVETALVCHIAAGETIASTAERMHIKEPTARGYLKSIFIKTGTRRQTELVVLMLSSLIRMKRDVLQEALSSAGSERALGLRA
jgi:DNA-binding CsgD family transcriptional regulator